MSIIVTDAGFAANDYTGEILDLSSDTDPDTLTGQENVGMIRIDFPSFADGRGFTLARLLRLRGYKGHIRAFGHVIADQYAMARRSGFDDVEISEELAARQPEDQWAFRADWKAHDYQARVRGAA